MADLNRILGQLLNSGAAGGFAGSLAGSLAGGLLGGKGGRHLGGDLIKMGGLAAVGALAYGAYQKYMGEKDGAVTDTSPLQTAPEGSPFLPEARDVSAQNMLGLTLVRAMIAAARCDGTLDTEESLAIYQKIEALPLADDERRLLVEEMGRSVDMDSLVAGASSVELASEIYMASLLAISADTAAEKAYLAMLAARLRLPDALVQELHKQVEGHAQPS